ncbi:MAG TPA: host attachment protein [Acidiferrobacterales bacterium]|nr:host attachment protein [Acidiferrobacterales bacterium]
MLVTWILAANGSQARLFANVGSTTELRLLKEFTHPESREKGSELVTDRTGLYESTRNKHGAFTPTIGPKQNAMEHFAIQLAKELEHGRVDNQYEQLVLIAPPHFLGLLTGHLNDHVRSLVHRKIKKNYTELAAGELAALIKQR